MTTTWRGRGAGGARRGRSALHLAGRSAGEGGMGEGVQELSKVVGDRWSIAPILRRALSGPVPAACPAATLHPSLAPRGQRPRKDGKRLPQRGSTSVNGPPDWRPRVRGVEGRSDRVSGPRDVSRRRPAPGADDSPPGNTDRRAGGARHPAPHPGRGPGDVSRRWPAPGAGDPPPGSGAVAAAASRTTASRRSRRPARR